MNNLIKFTFDIFAHVIPGIIILVAFSMLTISLEPSSTTLKSTNTGTNKEIGLHDPTPNNTQLKHDLGMASDIMNNLQDTGKGVFVLILAYIVGFAVSPLGKSIYRKIGKKLWPKIYVENDIEGMHISDKYVLIRQHSPANFEYVERWNMYASLSHNLAVACLVFFVVSIIQIFIDVKSYILTWSMIGLVSVILFFIFIKSAVVYSQWAGRDLNSAISALNLREKS